MKRILSAILAVSLLSGTAVMAQQNGQSRGDQNYSRQDRNDQNRNDQGPNNQGRYDQNRNDRSGNQGRQGYGNVRASNPRWSPGDRLSNQYRQSQYAVGDWQQRGLKKPPKNYRWVRDDDNNYFLVSNSAGLIRQTVYRDEREQQWQQRYSRTYSYNDDAYYQECRNAPDPAGVLAGGLIGALLGQAAGNGRSNATIAGVIVGTAVGAALTRNLQCEDRSYAYKSYYDGFNAGRPNTTYKWSNPRTRDRGTFRVGSYYNDPAGFRCANYTQVIYVQGRQQTAKGRACRQPDGTWAIVS